MQGDKGGGCGLAGSGGGGGGAIPGGWAGGAMNVDPPPQTQHIVSEEKSASS